MSCPFRILDLNLLADDQECTCTTTLESLAVRAQESLASIVSRITRADAIVHANIIRSLLQHNKGIKHESDLVVIEIPSIYGPDCAFSIAPVIASILHVRPHGVLKIICEDYQREPLLVVTRRILTSMAERKIATFASHQTSGSDIIMHYGDYSLCREPSMVTFELRAYEEGEIRAQPLVEMFLAPSLYRIRAN